MAIVVKLDEMLDKRNMTSTELCQLVGITNANLSILKTNKGRAIRFTTLNAICKHLKCDVGDILEYIEEDDSDD
jgi:putative transcriptional regulator